MQVVRNSYPHLIVASEKSSYRFETDFKWFSKTYKDPKLWEISFMSVAVQSISFVKVWCKNDWNNNIESVVLVLILRRKNTIYVFSFYGTLLFYYKTVTRFWCRFVNYYIYIDLNVLFDAFCFCKFAYIFVVCARINVSIERILHVFIKVRFWNAVFYVFALCFLVVWLFCKETVSRTEQHECFELYSLRSEYSRIYI